MNLIVKAIDSIGKFKADVLTSKMENSTKINDVKLQQYENAIKKLQTKDRVDRLELEIKYQEKLKRKAFIYNLISLAGTIGSIALTLCGITGSTFVELFSNSRNITYSLLIIFLQFSVWVISSNKNYIKEKFYTNYNKLRLLQFCVIFTSMICNYLFLISFLKPDNTLRHVFLIMMAVSIDLISLTFCGLAQDCKYRNYSYKNQHLKDDDIGLLDMVKFLFSYRLKTKLRTRYIKQLNEYESTFEYTKSLDQKDPDPYLTISDNQDNVPQIDENIETAETRPASQENITTTLSQENVAEENKQLQLEEKSAFSQNNIADKIATNELENSSYTPSYTLQAQEQEQIQEQQEDTTLNTSIPTHMDKENNLPTSFNTNTNITNPVIQNQNNDVPTNILNFTQHRNGPLRNYGIYENVKMKLDNLDDDTMLSAKKLAINPNEWKKIKERLLREGLAYEQNSRVRKKANVNINKVNNS